MQFVREFNDRTSKMEEGVVVPIIISIFKDKTFNFIMRTPPASYLLKKAAGIAKGSGAPNKDKVGKVTMKQIEDIAKLKLPDLNANDVAAAMKIIEGTAKNMGLEIIRG
jgi:large subunit ribosomal protein L11